MLYILINNSVSQSLVLHSPDFLLDGERVQKNHNNKARRVRYQNRGYEHADRLGKFDRFEQFNNASVAYIGLWYCIAGSAFTDVGSRAYENVSRGY